MNEKKKKPSRIHDRIVYSLTGLLLGLGAPIGWLFWRFILAQRTLLISWTVSEFSHAQALYSYMTIGTVIAFTIFGYLLGHRSDSVAQESVSIKTKLDQVNVLAITDALTGIYNARYLHDHMSLELESAQRYQAPLTCFILDIDDFKKINDTYGHPFGDVILTTLANVLQQSVRRVDIIGRLGGEEFLGIMPHTSLQTAHKVAERIRKSIQDWPFEVNGIRIPVTISMGVATFPGKGITDKSSLLKAADDALYRAKREGKNKTVLAETY